MTPSTTKVKSALVMAPILVLVAFPSLAAAQTLYVAGDVFLDLRRGSGTETTGGGSSKPDWTTGGGGVRVGGFLAPSWSAELGVDLGANVSRTQQINPLPLATGGLIVSPIASFSSTTSNRVTATSVLLGYHPALRSHARLRPGFRAGMTFLHSSTSMDRNLVFPLSSTTSPLAGGIAGAVLPIIPPIATRITTITNEVAATVAGEVAMDVTRHGAVVPEVRALGAGSHYVIRPGVGFRWTF